MRKEKMKGNGVVTKLLFLPIKMDNYVIRVIYWHPGGTIECLNDFTQQLENIMITVNSENKKCITGDINIDGLKISTNDQLNPSSI